MAKKPITAGQLLIPNLSKPATQQWANHLGFCRLIEKDWKQVTQESGVEDLIRKFSKTNKVVIPKRAPVQVTTKLVHQMLGLSNVGAAEPQIPYAIEDEIPATTGSMHHVKDVANGEHKAQFRFYFQNV